MANCSLAGIWMGNPTGSFYAMVMTMSQDGDTVSASITGWYVPAQYGHDQISYALTGTVSGGTFSLASTPSSNPLTFNGTCSDENDISGTLYGEMYPGTMSTATISCVRLDTTYPDSITSRWQGGTGPNSAQLSLMQSGTSVSGVGPVSVNYQGQQVNFDVSVSGSVDYPNFSLSLTSTNPRAGWTLTFSGSANANALTGEIQEIGPITLNRVPPISG